MLSEILGSYYLSSCCSEYLCHMGFVYKKLSCKDHLTFYTFYFSTYPEHGLRMSLWRTVLLIQNAHFHFVSHPSPLESSQQLFNFLPQEEEISASTKSRMWATPLNYYIPIHSTVLLALPIYNEAQNECSPDGIQFEVQVCHSTHQWPRYSVTFSLP